MPDIQTPEAELEELLSEDENPEEEPSNEEGEQQTENEEEQKPEPNPELETLRAEVDKLKNFGDQVADLRRSVGRIQALEQRFNQSSSNDERLEEEITKQFGGIHELLGTIVDGIDETAIDATTRNRVKQAQQQIQNAIEKTSLRKETQKETLDALRKQYPQLFGNGTQNQDTSELQRKALVIEEGVVAMFEDRNLNPDDPSYKSLWDEGAKLIQQGKSAPEVRAFFREKLNSAGNEENAAGRRQESKRNAGRGSPSAAGGAMTFDDRLSKAADSDNIDEGIKLLRDLGINI